MLKGLKNKLLAGLVTCACLFAGAGFGVGVKVASADSANGAVGSGDNPSVTQGVTAPFTQGSLGDSILANAGVVSQGEPCSRATLQNDGVGVNGTEIEGYSLEIVSKNVSYSDSIYMLYAVDAVGVELDKVQLLFWSELQGSYVKGTEAYARTKALEREFDGVNCGVYYSAGLSAKRMNDLVYCRAYAVVDGVEVYSDVLKYSVVDYVYEMRANHDLTEKQTKMFAEMLDYGAAAQDLLDYRTDELANATYYTVSVENGTLEDGFAYGRYLANSAVTITANPAEEDWAFAQWVDAQGNVVGGEKTLTVTANSDKSYIAEYKQMPVLEYELNADGKSYSVVGIGGYTDAELVIPAMRKGLPVTAIAIEAFFECQTITSVIVGENVTVIGEAAFEGCEALKRVTLSDSVTDIEDYAFADCVALELIGLGKGVAYIGSRAFYGCDSLSAVCYSGTADEWADIDIGSRNTALTDATLHYYSETEPALNTDGTAYDGYYWYYDEQGYISIWEYAPIASIGLEYSLNADGLGYTVTGIGTCTDTELIIPAKYNGLPVTNIGGNAFQSCSSLTSVEIPDSVTSIGDRAFENCSSLTAVYITSIEAWYNISFGDAYANPLWYAMNLYLNGELVTELIIPDTVTKIKAYAFLVCSSLTSVVIPDSVTSIGNYAFQYCSSLTSVEIPDSVTSIGRSAFSVCSSLTSVVIGDSVTSIGYQAFYGCSSMTSVVIGDSVTSIGYAAFYDCTSLTSVVIPDSVVEIGEYAFSGCKAITSISIGEGLKTFGNRAFNCASLISITVDANNDTYKDIDGNLYTKDGKTLACYAIGKPSTEFVVMDGITTIGDYAFYEAKKLTNIVLSDSVTSIGSNAFYGCSSLTSVVIPDSVTYIGDKAFYKGNGSLTRAHYKGTESQWSKISKGTSLGLTSPYYYSEKQPGIPGNFWHYVDGGIKVWT